MKAGFAKKPITPPLGTHLFGFGGRDIAHGCESIHDELFVRALYLDHGHERALILSYDVLFFDRADADRFKAAIGRHFDILPRQILINCSHTHVGPVTGSWAYADYRPIKDSLYIDDIERATIAAATEAREAMEDVTLAAGRGRTQLPISRRHLNDEGHAEWRPDAEAEIYDGLPVTLLKNKRGEPVCLLYSIACHPSTTGGFTISADYPGAAARYLAQHLGRDVAMFLQGCGGDTKACVIADGPKDDSGGATWRAGTWDDIDEAGRIAAREVIATLENLRDAKPALSSAITEVPCPLAEPPTRAQLERDVAPDQGVAKPLLKTLWAQRQLQRLDRGEQLARTAPVLVQHIRIAENIRLVALEGEPVGGFGHLIEKTCGDGITFPLGYSNGQGLYLPTERMLTEGGYEVESAYEYGFPANLTAGYEPLITQAVAELSGAQRG